MYTTRMRICRESSPLEGQSASTNSNIRITTDFETNLSEVNFASAKPISFEDADVFIQNIHAARCRSSAFSMRASPASERTSAIAA